MPESFGTPVLMPPQQRRGSGVCELYVIRHGTTTLNVENRYRGRRDVPLDAQGYQDAVDAARMLSGTGLDAVYTGPLRRTIATAQIIADEARVPDLRIIHGLNNVDYGAWEGMTSEEAAMFDPVAFDLYRTDPKTAVCPAGERLADAQGRAVETLAFIASRHRGQRVACVSHAVIIRLIVARLHGVAEGANWRIPVGRGSVTHFVADDEGLRVALLPTGSDVD